ncbi:MAG: NADH-quinone oxidoreductase subunit L [Pedosphaera sp.]|nr:NADH-quinone oxidoreductase subunit L [Pedosphaera sp.]
MTWIIRNLWLIPALPLLAAGLGALLQRPQRRLAATLSIGSMAVAFLIACGGFAMTLGEHTERQVHNFPWFQFGETLLQLGWVLDPLTASMLVMITFVGGLIFIYSVGYMARDENFTRFFCFLSLFAAAMLGLVISNNLLMLFMCWELVGLASYLLIGFWHHKPSAAAAAKKAFITTRVGDIGFLLGIVWLYHETGTLLFYSDGAGCLEQGALAKLVAQTTVGGMFVSTAISLLLFCGAVGKSGQFPLHVWLPDAMEGPTPVSALIHAATMVTAGVFLVARMYPLFNAQFTTGLTQDSVLPPISTALQVVTWTGAITAVFAALIAVAQTDIKRILAYSTVSQLGYMFVGLGVGGPAVGMFHLLTHAFFKALLFLGAGSVIHGCHEEQDIRRMGGLCKRMPVTFTTYAVGMLALSGFPLVFSGFWSKDEILHSAMNWPVSKGPFILALTGAVLTAFYMTRQMWFVFFRPRTELSLGRGDGVHDFVPHESPPIMTLPLVSLAACAVLLSIFATPVWPWFDAYLAGHLSELHLGWSGDAATGIVMVLSIMAVVIGLGSGWALYSRVGDGEAIDPIEQRFPGIFAALRERLRVDEFYEITILRLSRIVTALSDGVDRFGWSACVDLVGFLTVGLAWMSRYFDQIFINSGFDVSCENLRGLGRLAGRLQNGQAQRYLRILAFGVVLLIVALAWMGDSSR